MRLYITRHGQTDWNMDHRLQGQSDIPLNDTGRAQAVSCGEALRGAGIELIMTSPLSRAKETAHILNRYLGEVPIICDELLMERCFGKLEGQSMYVSEAESCPPEFGVEPRERSYERIRTAMEKYRKEYPDKTILVVTHGGVLFELLCGVKGERLEVRPSELLNAGINCIEYNEEPVLSLFNLSKEAYLKISRGK